MRVTVKDIAKLAGVTQPTVSKALNNEPGVSEETRMRILSIAKELNYVPNLAAKRLVTRQSNCIGLIWPRIEGLFYFHLCHAIEREVTKRGLTFLISVANPAEAVHTFNEHFVDRVLFWEASGWAPDMRFVKEMEAFQGELLLMGGASLPGAHRIDIDRKAGIYKAVQHLAQLGHRKITYIGNPNDKLNGYMQGMFEFGMEHHPDYFIKRGIDGKAPEQAIQGLFARPASERPTALIIDSQGMLFQMLKWFRKLRVSIPDDLSLIVYDDVPELEDVLDVPLTTVGPNIGELARRAVEILAGELPAGQATDTDSKEQALSRGVELVIEPVLTVRQSTKSLPVS
ncbi:LacI family DNA-binding transcriptional regulator [Paenibacillus ginsengarvi]|uniref:LacI family DNA-binding transcriptional regulator n=1 Tax=Paenibacillus ginsengarvi TaxID=400777 RepID=UPI0011C3B897|nr:LacI family DNA-binding transcriptional regulator [Paenibacillus ginsengarvi]